jgi:hypothetical protein
MNLGGKNCCYIVGHNHGIAYQARGLTKRCCGVYKDAAAMSSSREIGRDHANNQLIKAGVQIVFLENDTRALFYRKQIGVRKPN